MEKKLPRLRNTSLLTSDKVSIGQLLELPYWEGILYCLQANLKSEILEKIYFHLIFGNSSLQIRLVPGFVNIFIISDEEQSIRRELYDGTTIVFQAYHSEDKFHNLYNKIYPFPLGCNNNLNLKGFLPILKRPINVFFSGNLHKGRRKIFNYYSRLRYFPFFLQHRIQARLGSKFDDKYPSSYLRFTNGFMRGLSIAEYSDIIKDSKIVLAPHGSVSEECFRHYEAIKCGCVVISEKLPNNYFLSSSPIIQIENWVEGDRVIKKLLANPAQLEALHQDMLNWWDDVLSEKMVANYMQNIIERSFDDRVVNA